MQRTLALATVAVVALASVGVALAHLTQDGTQAVAASFSAARERGDTRVCTGFDGTYEIVNGRYVGQSTSTQPVLNGPIALTVTAVYNRTEQIGWMTGSVKIRSGDHSVEARLVGTLKAGASDTRTLDGFVNGPAGQGTKLYGSVTAAFTGTGGFAGGKIGEGGTNAALLAGRVCTPPEARIEVSGQIEALTTTAITVHPKNRAAVTCQIRPGVSPSTSNLRVGDRVEIVCGLVDGSQTLLRVKKKGRDDDDD